VLCEKAPWLTTLAEADALAASPNAERPPARLHEGLRPRRRRGPPGSAPTRPPALGPAPDDRGGRCFPPDGASRSFAFAHLLSAPSPLQDRWNQPARGGHERARPAGRSGPTRRGTRFGRFYVLRAARLLSSVVPRAIRHPGRRPAGVVAIDRVDTWPARHRSPGFESSLAGRLADGTPADDRLATTSRTTYPALSKSDVRFPPPSADRSSLTFPVAPTRLHEPTLLTVGDGSE